VHPWLNIILHPVFSLPKQAQVTSVVLFNIGPVTPNRINGLFDSVTKPRQSPSGVGLFRTIVNGSTHCVLFSSLFIYHLNHTVPFLQPTTGRKLYCVPLVAHHKWICFVLLKLFLYQNQPHCTTNGFFQDGICVVWVCFVPLSMTVHIVYCFFVPGWICFVPLKLFLYETDPFVCFFVFVVYNLKHTVHFSQPK
jgi:hypothetical protein